MTSESRLSTVLQRWMSKFPSVQRGARCRSRPIARCRISQLSVNNNNPCSRRETRSTLASSVIRVLSSTHACEYSGCNGHDERRLCMAATSRMASGHEPTTRLSPSWCFDCSSRRGVCFARGDRRTVFVCCLSMPSECAHKP